MKIKIYTSPHCKLSEEAKTFFRRRQLPFEELTTFKEGGNRLEMFELTGQISTPTIVIDQEIILGFNHEEMLEIIKRKKTEEKDSN